VWNDDGTLQELGLCGECEEATTEFARNKICDECGCKGGCELTCVYVCGEPCEDVVGCCEKCDMEIVRDSDEHDNCLIIDGGDSADKFCCQRCGDMKTCEHCEGAVSDEGGIIVVMGQEMTICESCDMGGDCYDGFLDEYHYNAETNDYEEENDETCDGCMEVFHEDELACLCSNEKCGLFQKNCCKDCCAKNKCEDCVEEDA
jgi:hypothetical protein